MDDEPQLLDGVVINLKRKFDTRTALSGEKGLRLLESDGPFEVVVSDMRMPEMDGVAFLKEVRRRAPDSIRILLTGYSDTESAIAAVNEGGIFRYLKKPCPPAMLKATIDEAVAEYRLNRVRTEDHAKLMKDLSDLDTLKEDFLANVSHELRTPLTIMMGSIGLLRTQAAGPLNPDQSEIIEDFNFGACSLMELIDALLDVRELKDARNPSASEDLSLREFVHTIEAAAAALPHTENTQFSFHPPRKQHGTIRTDCAKVALIVRNLASNAFKFTEQGRVDLTIEPEGSNMIIEVRDTGIGIPADQLANIFDCFRQGDGSMTRNHGGVGLGLYIVERSVEQLGGKIDLESAPGVGSVFRVRIPGYSG